ncbi:exopolyphosphatase [Actinotalea sp. M2MS4P-6]|uniref:Ppx/GppA phosphatase family protein n=1 Tax=Actinotalea sp. M2MS4P-6 TaxID=2983762 RepID=UPI0021E3E575|nr:exopolyphosphatase [Actinotalea sp. M2MS4P-6]MCV2396368.1 exopolyphosphatase [Actinotalea sp. M2MS4P-6]
MTRVAAVDCGTNSLRLLVADVDPASGRVADVVRRQEVVRLGEGVDRTGRIAPQALARTLEVTRRYAAEAAELGVTATRFAATSASRDASNRDEFVAGVLDAIGVEPEVLTGAEEAELSFRGATSALAGRHPAPFLVCDLGGGSTELVLGAGSMTAAFSMDVGSVRLHERHAFGDPPTAEQAAAACADIAEALDEAALHVALGDAATLVGVAGTVTTITAHALRLDRYDSARVDGAVLGVTQTLEACRSLLAMTRAERAALPYVHPGRVDVIGAGALVWADVVARVQDEVASHGGELTGVVTSERDILDGLAMSAAGVQG